MDFTGLGRFTAYKLNRPLTAQERSGKLELDKPASAEPLDWLSVIKINSSYLELVDRWYSIRGFSAWMGLLLGGAPTAAAVAFFLSAFGEDDAAMLLSVIAIAIIFAILAVFGWYGFFLDCFRKTHYPIRLNRRTRQVYAFRPDGTVLQAPWDRLFLCAVKNELTMWQTSEDVRAHVLAEDGKTILDTFTLAYPTLGDRAGLMRLWEYIRRYMEEPDGVEKNYRLTETCMPVDGRREGLVFGLVRTFAPYVKWPIMQLLASPLWALTVVGRWLAMSTSKVPVWPAEVEAACQVDPGDPYQKDWRQNGKYGFYELGWPAICFVVGLAVVVASIVWLLSALM
ncbi:hypothetical protein QFW77_04920 [Luteimonas sp. RD2P54]|uniref:DUF6708 domain-containing protein n=1 Tax=Luteimonas endophytica TaxID=3042023 RepID=A0ABT6J691_9GAMM|nr:DUF6708 domain-containing protein [Luteimonas endophytica]MDH5822333.1 hypothetical protein [Luteimonas endophytica]